MCLDEVGSVEISGEATLCFDVDGSGFKGSIAARDHTCYVITGVKCHRRAPRGGLRPENEPISLAEDEGHLGQPVLFDVHVVDCDIGEEYSLQRVQGFNGDICTFTCACVNFTPDQVYRGQKAEVITKQLLGQTIASKRKLVCVGNINLMCSHVNKNRNWVL
ncbi:unnamed protein product [Meganyctiphanes norvegica]|uniref:Uncharacterized protein n=1 Tax=Meganyctiphanes norvegica TaxID=48144 RepID=A0AAV2RUN2_MEGNR